MNSEREILQRARTLDVDALAFIFDEYYPPIYRYTYFHTQHIQTAEDLAARVFQRLLEHLHTGRGPQQHLQAWLYRVAYNLIVDNSRRQQHRNHASLPDDLPAAALDMDAAITRSQLIERTHRALARLTPRQRDIIILRYLMEMTPSEIAEILAVSVGSVKALQHRGIKALRRELQLDQQETMTNE